MLGGVQADRRHVRTRLNALGIDNPRREGAARQRKRSRSQRCAARKMGQVRRLPSTCRSAADRVTHDAGLAEEDVRPRLLSASFGCSAALS